MKPKSTLFLALVLGGSWTICRADTAPGVDWYVANAKVIEVVQAETPVQSETFPAPPGSQRAWVKDVLKGVDTAQEVLIPKGSLNAGQAALALFRYAPPKNYESTLHSSPEAQAVISVWPMDTAGKVTTQGVPAQTQDGFFPDMGSINLDLIKRDITSSSPEEVGLNRQVLDALLFPDKFKELTRRDAARATYVRFVVAILDLNRDVSSLAQLLESPDTAIRAAALQRLEALTGMTLPPPSDESPASLHEWEQAWVVQKQAVSKTPLRWPPVPVDLKTPPDAFPEPLLQAVQKNDADAFAKAFADWLDSGVMRDREIQKAFDLNRDIVERSNLGSALGDEAYLPAAPRLRPDVILNKDIPVLERMKAIALRAQIAHYKRFEREQAEAKAVVASAPPDSDILRRAAFWELRFSDDPSVGWVALTRLAQSGEDESTQRFMLGLCLNYHMDDDALSAASVEIQAGRQTFVNGLFAYLKAHRDDKAQWIGRLFCQERQEQVLPVMLSWLKDGDAQIRKVAAFNLCWLPSAEAVPNLLDAIRSERNPEVKAQIIVALAQIGDERGLDTLLTAARKPDASDDRDEIVLGLGRIRDPKALPVIADIVSASENSKVEDDNYDVLADAVNAFGYISHLYNAHAPDKFQTSSGIDPTQLKLGIAVINQWLKSQADK